NEKVAPADLNPNACGRRRAAQRPPRNPSVTCNDVLIIAVVYIRDASKPQVKSFSHSSCADEATAPGKGPPGRLIHAVLSEEAHYGIQVVGVECIANRFQQINCRSCHLEPHLTGCRRIQPRGRVCVVEAKDLM